MYEKILLPMDSSDNAELAAKRAIRIAEQYDAVLHVLYVAEKSREEPKEKGSGEKVSEEKNKGDQLIEKVKDQVTDHSVEIESNIPVGVPRTTIENYASDHDIDVIIMGSTGADGVSEKLLGSVSKYVVNEAPSDVLVVRHDSELT